MLIWNWFTGVLEYVGLRKKPGKILLLGLSNAGTTTLFQILRGDPLGSPRPRPYVPEKLSIGNRTFTILNLGGHPQALRMWPGVFPDVDAIVFLIDANDRTRISENLHDLNWLLHDEGLENCPVLILGNKIDLPGAASEDELRNFYNLHGQTTGKGIVPRTNLSCRPLELFMCSVLKGKGYDEGFRWLAQYID